MLSIRKIITSHWGVFIFCSAIVILTQFLILQPILKYSLFTGDDWLWLLNFRSLTINFFEKIVFIWTNVDIRQGAYAAYIGILGAVFGNNYSAYQYVTFSLKILATLTLFPLILLIFKNRLLALLTTIIYGINSATTGSFYWYMKGGIFPAIAFMNLFFISYYFTLLKNSKNFLFLSSVLILLSYVTSPTRIFPVFLIVLGIEIYWLYKHKSKANIVNSLIRLGFLLLPSILISKLSSVDPTGTVESTPGILLKQILEGNWITLLAPLPGIGYSLLTHENMKILGDIESSIFLDLHNYVKFLLRHVVWFFLTALALLGIIISKNPLKFIIKAFCINFGLDILMFYMATHRFFIKNEQILKKDPSLFNATKLPTIIAIFILTVAFMAFLQWLKEKRNYLLIPLFIGPMFSLIFFILMWVSIGDLLEGYNSIHYYYQVPAIGTSLFLAAILTLFYEKFKKIKVPSIFLLEKLGATTLKKVLLRILALLIITGVIFGFYLSSSISINHEFLGIYPEKVEVKDQQILHDKLVKKIVNVKKEDNILVYFELPEATESSKYYERSLFLGTQMFGDFIYWQKQENTPHCVGHIYNKDNLQSSIIYKEREMGFVSSGRCLQILSELPENSYFVSSRFSTTLYSAEHIYYPLNNLYAYKIENGEFIDIKENLLKELKIQ